MPLISTEPTVWIIQQPKPKDDGWVPNFEPAEKFGRIQFLFQLGDRAFAQPDKAMELVRRKLSQFDERKDHLLWGNFGDPATLWITIFAIANMGHKRLSMLYWSRGQDDHGRSTNERGYYFPVVMEYTGVFTHPER